ncbi:MFS transporter [Streptomyces canus]|uniref:MFS transporter n=1 Tax=Streptomyces canus TaxID=58343 RepID=UPI00367B7BAE
MPTSGAAGDRYGHKRVVLTGLGVFGAGSPACGLAPSVGVLVAARVVQGAGAALLLPGTLAIIGRAFPDDAARARAIGVWAGIGSGAIGIAVAGAVAGHPGDQARFRRGFHAVALGSACLYAAATAPALTLLPGALTPRHGHS